MVVANPLWTLDKFKATVLNSIWPGITFFTLVATTITVASKLSGHELKLETTLLTVLGTVLGLVISFRTSSAYERYQEGRKLWSNIAVASRNLALMIWVHVPTDDEDTEDALKDAIEKKTMINLIQAFSVSVKHFLRGEPGVYYKDLFPLISFLPRYANMEHHDDDMLPLWAACHDPQYPHPKHSHHENPREAVDGRPPRQHTNSLPATIIVQPFDEEKTLRSKSFDSKSSRRKIIDIEQALPEVHCPRPLREAREPPKLTIFDYVPIFKPFRSLVQHFRKGTGSSAEEHQGTQHKKHHEEVTESNVPLEIILVLSSYMNYFLRKPDGHLNSTVASGMMDAIVALQTTLSDLERILNTPLPFAYQAHLRMSLWIYLFFLPFQVYASLGWYTIPGTTFAAFLLLGFLEIGQEIENPFNYDLNDLDLDHFCLSLQRELHEITAFATHDPATYIFSPWNQPFAPSDRRTAAELINNHGGTYHSTLEPKGGLEPGLPSIRRTLVNNWRKVEDVTRGR